MWVTIPGLWKDYPPDALFGDKESPIEYDTWWEMRPYLEWLHKFLERK